MSATSEYESQCSACETAIKSLPPHIVAGFDPAAIVNLITVLLAAAQTPQVKALIAALWALINKQHPDNPPKPV